MKHLLLFSLLFPLLANAQLGDVTFLASLKPAASGAVTIEDNFTGDGDISGRVASGGFTWTEAAGSMDTASGVLRSVTGSYAKQLAVTTTTGSAEHWVLVRIVTTTGTDFPHIVMRYTDSSSPYYSFELTPSTGDWRWYYWDNAADTTATQIGGANATTHALNDRWGITITGTGTSTTARFWRNPTADFPISATEWDSGDTTPEATKTDDPGASAVDTGGIVGLSAFTSGTNRDMYDDFFGGDY